MELFVVEVGARGYCSKSFLCCLKKLGFSNKRIRSTIKNLSKSCMECCFSIWLARNNKEITPSAAKCNLNSSSLETSNLPTSLLSLKQSTKPVSNAKSIQPVGFIIKGNTCNCNSILQIFIVIPTLWKRVPLEMKTLSPILRAISLNKMSLCKWFSMSLKVYP